MLTLERITARAGAFRLTADLSVAPGQKLALLGPSGAGKSTLLTAIAGLGDVVGRILWDGRDLTPLAPAERPVTMLFQDGNLFPHMTARQNVGLGLHPNLRLTEAEWRSVDAALDRVGLAGLGERKPAALSGGQAARVALARAVLRHRPLLLLDEPFGGLGPALRAEMLALVSEIADEAGTTILMVTHQPEDVPAFAGAVIVVADGAAQPPVAAKTLFDDPPEALREYLGTQSGLLRPLGMPSP